MPPLDVGPWAGADLRGLLDFADAAEAPGFDSLWADNSVVGPRIEALTLVSAAAEVTDRITPDTAAAGRAAGGGGRPGRSGIARGGIRRLQAAVAATVRTPRWVHRAAEPPVHYGEALR